MVTPVAITQSSVALKVPSAAELTKGALAVNLIDGALYSKKHDGSIIRIEGDTGNGTIASAASIALGGVMAGVVDITGTTTITAIVLRDGQTRTVRFAGALTLTHGASLVLPGGASITTAAGDFATFRGYAAGVTRCTNYSFAAAAVTLASPGPIGATTPSTGKFTGLTVTTGNIDRTSAGTFQVNNYGGGTMEFVQRAGGAMNFYTGSVVTALQLSAIGAATVTAGFGCNSKAAQTAYALGAAATDLATVIALANKLRTMAINNGTGS